jgi:uncharacterized protein YacL
MSTEPVAPPGAVHPAHTPGHEHEHGAPARPGTTTVANPLETMERQRRSIVRLVRLAFFTLILTVGLLLTLQSQRAESANILALDSWVPISIAIIIFCIAMAVDLITPSKKLGTISAIFFGLVGGLLATLALSAVIDLLIVAWVPKPEVIAGQVAMVKVMLGIALCYLGVSSVVQTQDDFRLVIPYVEFAKQTRGSRPTLLDTSALIDARIADIAATGLLQSPLVVPRFVITELQTLADSADKLKRARGRRGLDVVTRLQRLGTLDVSIDDSRVTAIGVDQMLVELATQLNARILTTDLALCRVAQIQDVTALNLPEIANAFKPALIAGEQLAIRIVKPGEQAGQGVGYLDDGTMVVVDHGAELVGSDTQVLVTGTMQTTGGRLVFARTIESVIERRTRAAEVQSAVDARTDPAVLAATSQDQRPTETAPQAAVPLPASLPPSTQERTHETPSAPVRPGNRRPPPSPRNPRR